VRQPYRQKVPKDCADAGSTCPRPNYGGELGVAGGGARASTDGRHVSTLAPRLTERSLEENDATTTATPSDTT